MERNLRQLKIPVTRLLLVVALANLLDGKVAYVAGEPQDIPVCTTVTGGGKGSSGEQEIPADRPIGLNKLCRMPDGTVVDPEDSDKPIPQYNPGKHIPPTFSSIVPEKIESLPILPLPLYPSNLTPSTYATVISTKGRTNRNTGSVRIKPTFGSAGNIGSAI